MPTGCYKQGVSPLASRIGEKHGRLTILDFIKKYPAEKSQFVAKCECGKHITVGASKVVYGHTKSCGCLRNEMRISGPFKHGQCKSPARGGMTREYHAWAKMNARCTNPNLYEYMHYGARGIRVCERWEKSFENFFSDMGPRPTIKHSVDRIDVNGNYEPGNCRWATTKEQARNRRTNARFSDGSLVIEFFEKIGRKPQSLTVWRRKYGMDWDDVRYYFMAKLGMLA